MNIVAFSGGKDSTAMLLRLIELGEHIDEIVFADTGFEFPELYTYIKKIEKYINRPIKFLYPKKDFWNFANGELLKGNHKGEKRGLPYITVPCWWMRESKYNPINRLGKDNIVYLGIAYDEQQRVQKDSTIRYPLIEWKWTEQDCVDYLNEKGLLNPLYVNFNRLGCYWCPKQGSGSLYVMWKNYPKLWIKMKEFEKWQYDNKGIKLYNKELSQMELAFELGHKPKKLPKYGCSHGCESVKRAFEEKQCDLSQFGDK